MLTQNKRDLYGDYRSRDPASCFQSAWTPVRHSGWAEHFNLWLRVVICACQSLRFGDNQLFAQTQPSNCCSYMKRGTDAAMFHFYYLSSKLRMNWICGIAANELSLFLAIFCSRFLTLFNVVTFPVFRDNLTMEKGRRPLTFRIDCRSTSHLRRGQQRCKRFPLLGQ